MPRKPEPSFRLKQIIWDLAATTGAKNLSALRKDIDYRVEQLRQNENEYFVEDTPDIRTVQRIIESDINRLAPEVVVAKLPPHVWPLRHDYKEIKQLAEGSTAAKREPLKETEIERRPYKGPHQQKIRELAKALAGEINIPTFWDKDLWRNLPVEFKEGKYSLPIGEVEIGQDKQIKVKYSDIGAGVAAPHLVKGLYSHLSTSGLSKFAEMVGDKGKLNSLVVEIEQYSQALLELLKLIADEVEGYRVKMSFHDEAKPGLTKWFIITTWHYVLWSAVGYGGIDDSLYRPHDSILDTGLWQLRCGAYTIGITRNKKTLKTYESQHKKLRLKYAEHPLGKDIAVKYQGLNETVKEIRQRLEEFSDIEHLPGHCELC